MTQNDLVVNHIPLVHSIANRLNAPSVKDDLVGEGMVALIKCAGRFDSDRGITFGAYAKHRVKGAMIHYLKKNNGEPTEPLGSHEHSIGRDGQADRIMLRDALRYYLHPIEEWVIVQRYFEKNSIQSIAAELGFKVGRVSQIHSNAIMKLKTAFTTEDAPQEESDDNQNALLQVVRKMIWDEWGVEVTEL